MGMCTDASMFTAHLVCDISSGPPYPHIRGVYIWWNASNAVMLELTQKLQCQKRGHAPPNLHLPVLLHLREVEIGSIQLSQQDKHTKEKSKTDARGRICNLAKYSPNILGCVPVETFKSIGPEEKSSSFSSSIKFVLHAAH